MMTFMPAVSERKYDWEKKQVFVSLSGSIPSLLYICCLICDYVCFIFVVVVVCFVTY